MVHPSLDWIDGELEALRTRTLHRSLVDVESAPGPELRIGGRSYLCFASNDYLGLAADPRVRAGAIAAVTEFGAGAGGSRLITGNTSLHRQLEGALAALKGTEEAIVFSSGYAANLGTIGALAGHGDAVFSDALNHASIIDGCRLSGATVHVYPHRDTAALRALLQATEARRRLIVTDSVFSMDGDLAPLPALADLAEEFGCMLMVDEAHATGVLGETGSGAVEHFGLSGRVPILMGTLSKALASLGGYVAGEARLVDYLRNRARAFIYTTGLPPAAAGAALAAIEVVHQEPERRTHVLSLAQSLSRRLRELGYETPLTDSAILPVLAGDSQRALALAAGLRERGIFAPAVRPPTVPEGSARIRLSLMATHTEQQVERLIQAFASLRPVIVE